MRTGPITIKRANWQFNLSRMECSELSQADRQKSFRQLKSTLVPIIARVLGLGVDKLTNNQFIDNWLKNILKQGRDPVQVAEQLLDLKAPKTQELLEGFSVPNTSFFRDIEQHDIFRGVFDHLFSRRTTNEPVRIWVPGTSGGHEAYTIAMILRSDGYLKRAEIDILGTDIIASLIDRARAGRYLALDERANGRRSTRELTLGRYRDYFTTEPSVMQYWAVTPEIKSMARFALDNIVFSETEGPFDLISCNHLLMHLERQAARRARKHMMRVLKPGGYVVSTENHFRGIDQSILQSLTSANSAYVAYRKI